jgi:MoaA/NifB/PqqE/SkfB family radical SAM enzyme
MIPFQTVMIRRSLVDRIIKEDGALFDESLKQIDDYDLFLRLKKYSHYCIKEPLSHYRIHNGGLTTSSTRMVIVETQLGINIKRKQWQNLPRMLRLLTEFKLRGLLLPYKNMFDKWIERNRVTLQIEPTTRCNLHCTKCSRGNDTPIVDLKKETLLELTNTHNPHTIILQGLGEPFMHPDFERICDMAKQNCKHLIVITNGTILNKPALEHIDHIVVSLDTLNADLAKASRGSNYNLAAVIDNIRSLASSNKPTVAINYVRTVNNFNQQKSLQVFCDDLNIPLHVTPIQNWYNPEEPEWQAAHEAVHYEREMSGKKDKPFRDNCPFLDGRKFYYDARGIQHPCCIRMRYDQVHPTRGTCRSCPE